MTSSTPFRTLFAVPMTCESCLDDISKSLYKVRGISKVEASLNDQLVSVEGTAAPSAIVAAIQGTGRDAILRGSGASNSAAVCILEMHSTAAANKVRGLARIVQVSPTLTLVDLTIRGLSPGKYWATVRATGDISQGAVSAGEIWTDPRDGALHPRGILGAVEVGQDRAGSVFIEKPIQILEMIGRGIIISRQDEGLGKIEGNDENTLIGVIARSAGVWENNKTVCSCSGKTLWEEREAEVRKGIL